MVIERATTAAWRRHIVLFIYYNIYAATVGMVHKQWYTEQQCSPNMVSNYQDLAKRIIVKKLIATEIELSQYLYCIFCSSTYTLSTKTTAFLFCYSVINLKTKLITEYCLSSLKPSSATFRNQAMSNASKINRLFCYYSFMAISDNFCRVNFLRCSRNFCVPNHLWFTAKTW